MRILWLSHLLPFPPIGGVRQRSYNLLKAVSSKHAVTLVALSQKAQQKNEKEIRSAVDNLKYICEQVYCYRMPCDASPYGKAFLLLKSFFSFKCYLAEWTRSLQFKNAVAQLCSDNRYDIVYLDCIALVPYLKELPPLPKILNHHNIESQLMFHRFERETNPLIKLYCYQEAIKRKRLEKRYCSKFAVNICVSNLDRKRLKAVSPEIPRIEVVENGVDLERLWPPDSKSQKSRSLLFAGGMTRFPNRDGVEYFISEIWPILKERVPEIEITVVGRKPPPKLLSMAENDQSIRVLGFVEEIKPYYDETTVYVCPIRDGGGTRLKVLDAMSAGKAVVSTHLCSEGIDAEDGREILIADSPEGFVEHIESLLMDEKLRTSMAESARAFVEANHDFTKIGEHLNYIFESVYQEGRG